MEEKIQFDDISLNIVDTAGIHNTKDIVEQIGVMRAKNAAEDADLIIYVVDGSIPLDDNDKEIVHLIRDRKAIVLLNKSDLDTVVDGSELEILTGKKVISVSAKDRSGLDIFKDQIKSMFYRGDINFNDQIIITSLRHKEALSESLRSLEMVIQSISQNLPEDFYSIDLTDAYEKLGTIIGESVDDDVVNEIFSRFCMGK